MTATPTTTAAPTTATGAGSARVASALGAAAVAASAAIHLQLWLTGYRHIHLIGPAFLLQAGSGFAVAVAVLARPRLVPVLAGALFCAGSVGALVLSATVGFLGLHDGLGVPWAMPSLVVELTGLVLLSLAAAALRLNQRTDRSGLSVSTSD